MDWKGSWVLSASVKRRAPPARAATTLNAYSSLTLWTTALKGLRALLRNFLLVIQQHRFHASHHVHFLFVQLIQEPLRPQVEGTARQLSGFARCPPIASRMALSDSFRRFLSRLDSTINAQHSTISLAEEGSVLMFGAGFTFSSLPGRGRR